MLILIRVLGMLTSLVVVAALSGAALFFLQERMIFHPQPVSAHTLERLRSQEIRLPRGSDELHGWFNPGPAGDDGPVLLYFGGNAEEVSGNIGLFGELGVKGYLLVNYRGYGLSQGKPGQKALYQDALFLHDWLTGRQGVSPQRIVVMGRSLGTAVAVHLASQRPVAGVVLISPYDSLLALGQYHYPWLPVATLLRHRFEAGLAARSIRAPMLAVAAREDRIIPLSHSQALVSHWAGPSALVTLNGVGHNDLGLHPRFAPLLREFLAELKPARVGEAAPLPRGVQR